MIFRISVKLLIAIIYSILVLAISTDLLSSFVENRTDALVKINSNLKIERVYLLPNKISDFYLFHEATFGFMCSKKTVFLKDSFILFNDINPSIVNFIAEKKNHSIQTFKMKYNGKKDYYEIDIADKPSSFNHIEYVLYHFFKFIITMSFLILILLCADYYLFDSDKRHKNLNLAFSIAFSFIATGVPFLILLRTYFLMH